MAAPKNRIYCPDAGKPKLLFETEKKALTFIKFNAEEIEAENGFAPCRAYFCQCCAGWHVTHNTGYRSGISSVNAVVKKYRENQAVEKKSKSAENRIKKNAVYQLGKLLEMLKNAEERGIHLSEYQLGGILSTYSQFEDDCKAKNIKKRIKYYLSLYCIEL